MASASSQSAIKYNPMLKKLLASAAIASILAVAPAQAAEISTHVLNISQGKGGADVPVTLSKQASDGSWQTVASSLTQSNGRAEDFGNPENLTPGVYLLSFDVAQYYAGKSDTFFPVITVAFNVTEQDGHYHVPVLLSAYGYSTYRGN